MTASVCPTCKSPFDSARAPVARVRGARIVTYCSAECADAPVTSDTSDTRAPSALSALSDTRASSGTRGSSDTSASSGSSDSSGARRERVDSDYAARPRPRGNRKRKIIALSAAIMAGGMVITIINAVSPSTPSDVSAAEGPRAAAIQGKSDTSKHRAGGKDEQGKDRAVAEAAEAAETAPAAVIDLTPDALFGLAKDSLNQLMGSTSPRVQRIAAMALSRTGDARAMELLRGVIEQESVELRKIEIAYALARAGDVKAQKLLRRRLKHKHRDVRVDAARALVQLGDDSGSEVLRQVLSLRSHRLGAAGLLARLGEQRGVVALQKELDDSGSAEETRMRAAVALGRAGDASVREHLIAMLEDRRYHVGAADALAALGDAAAVPALIRQLALPSLRVRAAVALRRLDAGVDLEILGAALQNGSDPARVSAAEAILVLTGPRRLAERE